MKTRFKRPVLFLLIGLLFTGCALDGRPPKVPALGATEVDLRWSTPARPADPVATISVHSQEAPFLIDTGTSELLLTSVFAQRAGLPKSEEGFRREPLAYSIAGRHLWVDRFLVIEAPPLDEDGWGGIYSPQLLTVNATVILDFLRLKLVSIEVPTATSSMSETCRIETERYVTAHHPGLHLHKFAWRGRAFGTVLIEGGLVGKPSLLLDVDTGKAVSALRPSYIGSASASGRPGPRMVDIRGVEQVTTVVAGQSLQLGTLVLSNRSVVAHDAGGKLPDGTSWDGNLGIDILKDAIVALCPVGSDAIFIGVR